MRTSTLAILILYMTLPLAADYRHAEVERLIDAQERPAGVVFELIAWEDDSWNWAAPMLQRQVERLRAAYPGLEIALVSHGYELFDLSLRSGKAGTAPIKRLEALAGDGVDIHVCGNFAGTRFYEPEDFFAFVDVSASGPAQLEDYVKLGFVPILLEPPHASD